MRKLRKKSRSFRMTRNWCIVLLLMLVLYALGEVPALTKQALVQDILHDNLMDQGEIVWETGKDVYNQKTMYILSGGTVVQAKYYWDLLRLSYSSWSSNILYGNEGVTCVPVGEPGAFLVMGNLPEAASAVLDLRIAWSMYGEKDREYTAEGTWKTDKVISFTIAETYEGDAELFDRLRRTGYPEGYYDYTLRLYDAAGKEIGVWANPEIEYGPE